MNANAVLVLGATGLVGTHVVGELSERGFPVTAVSRKLVRSRRAGINWVQADVTHPEELAHIPACARAVSTLPIWLTAEIAPNLIGNGLERLIAFSSSSVVTKIDASDEAERRLATDLAMGEHRLRSLSPRLTTTVLRPTMIYGGPGDRNVERIAAHLRRFRVFPLVGGGQGLRQPVHAADLGKAAVQALETQGTENETYVVAGAESLTVREMVLRIGHANGVRPWFMPVPLRPTAAAVRLIGKLSTSAKVPPGALERLTRDLVFDIDPAASAFGYAPRAFEPPNYRASL